MLKALPFDSLALAAAVGELKAWEGAKVQKAVQPDEHTLLLELYGAPGATVLLLSWHPQFARAHAGARWRKGLTPPPGFCAAFRARVVDGRISGVRQVGFDRILEIDIEHEEGKHRIVAELMGKHANVMLVGPDKRIVVAAKHVPASKSSRPVVAGHPYAKPPFPPRPPLWKAQPGDDLREFEGASPFLVKLLAARSEPASVVGEWVRGGFSPVTSPGCGAYPVSVAALGYEEAPIGDGPAPFGEALARHFATAAAHQEAEQRRASLLARLDRVQIAREAALSDLAQALDAAAKADKLQRQAELILAYGPSLPEGSSVLETHDYEGNPITIRLDPEKSYVENAETLFHKAKKAKGAKDTVADQRKRLAEDLRELLAFRTHVETAEGPEALRTLEEEATKRRWLHSQRVATHVKEDRPHEGHRVRELLGPNGYRVLYGENATSNDYVTHRLARPNDLWLHIRGSTSAHVVIVTGGKPEKVGPEVLRFAAEIAVKNSPSKHSKYVPVDWTLKKYVRKPRGAPAGTALYTHEKTLHVG
ncbi:MAG: NFACT family protein [Fimbriimonadaceae bacterium]|nr:NFACT family protein [Chthonomonadaceae bacterium]MCO5296941.1 NFACT family protein [Fimbriimonadaceae bacterium]